MTSVERNTKVLVLCPDGLLYGTVYSIGSNSISLTECVAFTIWTTAGSTVNGGVTSLMIAATEGFNHSGTKVTAQSTSVRIYDQFTAAAVSRHVENQLEALLLQASLGPV